MPLTALSKFEAFLSEAGGEFLQTHRSFIIAKNHIKTVSTNKVIIDKYEIPIGIQFREEFLQAIGMKNSN